MANSTPLLIYHTCYKLNVHKIRNILKEYIKMLVVIHLFVMYSSCKLFKKMCSLPVVFLSGEKVMFR